MTASPIHSRRPAFAGDDELSASVGSIVIELIDRTNRRN